MKNTLRPLKQTLKQFKETLGLELCQHASITTVTYKLIAWIDNALLSLFHKNKLHIGNQFCLLALGSYGRRELQLHSDIDLLLLHTENLDEQSLQRAQAFIQDCWDIGLDISHQLTTVTACANLAETDLSVISSILDMRRLCGRNALMEELQYQTHPLHMWPGSDFFHAKYHEQRQRHAKYGETAYNLEPNVKQGSGGLRDLQILASIAKRHFGIHKLADGIYYNFITEKEYEELIHCQHFLWRVRFVLHYLAGKPEERLLFDYQVKLAPLFGFVDQPHSLAIEQFMKAYFKVIKRNRELNEMLLQWFSEASVHHYNQQLESLSPCLQLSNNFIEVKHKHVFSKNPPALFELFFWLAKRPSISGVRASTVRLIREHLYVINKHFRASSIVTTYFISIFKDGNDPYYALHHMNKYGVLSQYLDCFASVTGQMQYDLFHVYTVDQHTLYVIRNLTRFLKDDAAQQFPLAVKLMSTIEKRHILYLAALFHDIAKGQHGDHSSLGAEEARLFCLRHHVNTDDANLIIWLVQHHLLMSQTAQRKDIYAPETIQQFCNLIPETRYLDYLYLLTVADICATNQTLWNSWKDSLLKELYRAASLTWQHQKTLLDETALCELRQQQALTLLIAAKVIPEAVNQLWQHFKNKYFIHEPPEVIARHTKAILECKEFPLVLISPHHSQGGTEVFIYMPHRDERFTITTTVLSNMEVSIQEAAILTCDNHFDLDTYIVLDEQHQAFFDNQRSLAIQQALRDELARTNSKLPMLSKRRLSRTLEHFNIKPRIVFDEEPGVQYTRLFLVAMDRPGLLANVTRIFFEQQIHLHTAKISTAGERAEDMFYISTQAGLPLNNNEKTRLQDDLVQQLS